MVIAHLGELMTASAIASLDSNSSNDLESQPEAAHLPEGGLIPVGQPLPAQVSSTRSSSAAPKSAHDKTFRFGTIGYVDRKISPKQLRQNPEDVLAAWERVKDKARKLGFTSLGKVFVEPTKVKGNTHVQVLVFVEMRGQRIIGRGTDLIEAQVLGELAKSVCQDGNGVTQVQLGWGWSVYGTS